MRFTHKPIKTTAHIQICCKMYEFHGKTTGTLKVVNDTVGERVSDVDMNDAYQLHE